MAGKRKAAGQAKPAEQAAGTNTKNAGKRQKKAAKEADTPAEQPASTLTSADLFDPELMAEPSRATLKDQYRNAQPYTHCVISKLCKPELLAAVRQEIITNIQATYKETDLFKVFQTGDLGNLDKLDKQAAAKLPTLMALKDALYSPEFRAFVREVTGCGELADKTDCSCNVYAQGGHLLCHDDVIGTRRVSYIIYLTDPDEPWTAEDGGALELYPLEQGQQHTPAVHPSVTHLPTFNSMVMFTVLPGKSFHSVQEVVTSDKPRMSISGWYHAPDEPENAHEASLQQLQRREEHDGGLTAGQDNLAADQYKPFQDSDGNNIVLHPPEDDNEESVSDLLSPDDLAYLIRYVNPTYLSEAAWPKIQAKFKEDGSVQLQQFLAKGLAEKILAATTAADTADGFGNGAVCPYESGVVGGWRATGPPHKQRYCQYDSGANGTAQQPVNETSAQACKTAGELLAQVHDKLFTSSAFQKLLRAFTTLNMVGHRGEIRRFRPGLDYTVAHYGILTKDPRLDVVLCFVSQGQQQQQPQQTAEQSESQQQQGKAGGKKAGKAQKDKKGQQSKQQQQPSSGTASGPSVWDDGEVGGFEAYLLADEDSEGAAAAEVYRQDAEDSGVLNVSPAANTLNLVLRDEGLMKFVKYVSAAAPGSRWDIAMEYLPEDDSDDEEEPEIKETAAEDNGSEEQAAAALADKDNDAVQQDEDGKNEAVEKEDETGQQPAVEAKKRGRKPKETAGGQSSNAVGATRTTRATGKGSNPGADKKKGKK